MKNIYIEDLTKEGERIIDFFMIKSSVIRVGKNGKEYLDIVLGDKTGDINSKRWNVQEGERHFLESLKEGDLVKIDAEIKAFQGNPQLSINRIRLFNDKDEIDISDFVKKAPEDSIDMYNFIFEMADSMVDEDFKKISKALLENNKEKLMYYPAASKNHHAEYGGLLYHIKRMLMSADAQSKIYSNLNRDLLLTGVIIHDMEKINEIESNEYGISSGYSIEGQLLGHIIQGIRELDKICIELNIPREKAIMLEHMILSHHYEPEFGSPKKPLFPEAELLHYLDIVDARMYDMEEALKGVSKGIFSDRIFVLENRKMYKPTFDSKNTEI